jgi:hypothetical protein
VDKLTTSDKVIAGSGLLLFICSFLPWFKLDFLGESITANGWDVGFFWAGIPALLGLAAAAAVLANKLADVDLPDLPVTWGMAFLIAGGISAAIVILKLLIGEDIVDRAWGLFLATLAAIGFAFGGYLKFQEDGGTTSTGRADTGNTPF